MMDSKILYLRRNCGSIMQE